MYIAEREPCGDSIVLSGFKTLANENVFNTDGTGLPKVNCTFL